MIREIIQKFLKKNKPTFSVYNYKNKDGVLDYDRYVQIQTEGNKKKIDRSWIDEDEIKFVSGLVKKFTDPQRGICHGTRRGLEQKWFSEQLSCEVIGTEISDTAKDFPNTVQLDFHESLPEWNENFDFVYSNSLDHSYDPKKALSNWVSMLKSEGICLIAHSKEHSAGSSRELDPFGVELEYFPYLVLQWSKGAFFVVDIVNYKEDRNYFVIKKRIS